MAPTAGTGRDLSGTGRDLRGTPGLREGLGGTNGGVAMDRSDSECSERDWEGPRWIYEGSESDQVIGMDRRWFREGLGGTGRDWE